MNVPTPSTFLSQPHRIRWWQFSLGTLLLLALLVCVGAAYWGTQSRLLVASRQNQQLLDANKQLMEERGILDVADPSQIVLEYRGKSQDPEVLRWKWRVHFPERNWRFACEIGPIEKTGHQHLPTKQIQTYFSGPSAQRNLELTVLRDLDSRPVLVFKPGVYGGDVRMPLTEEEFESLRRLDHPRKSQPKGRPLQVLPPDTRVEIMRIVANDSELERTGLLVYFERFAQP